MKLKSLTLWSALAVLVVAGACAKQSPTRPSDVAAGPAEGASVTDAATGITLTSPVLVSPADGNNFKFVQQPITLTFTAAVTTGSTPLTYVLEVASDTAFGSIVYSKAGLSARGSSPTSETIDRLAGDRTYYWRVRAISGSLVGPNARTRSFKIAAQVILGTPVLSSPGSNATLGADVTLTVNNVSKIGPAEQVFYRFEVWDSGTFNNLLFVAPAVPEQAGVTSVNVTTSLGNGTYWWRVQASDPANQVTTSFSLGNPFKVQLFDFASATFFDNPADVNRWPATGTITYIDTSGDFIVVDHDKRGGPDKWPNVGFGAGDLQYTLGLCANLQGAWYCSAAIQFWEGRELEAGGHPWEVGINWYYDVRWGRLLGWQPEYGELVGVWAGAGNLRDVGNVIAKERTNVVMHTWGTTYRTAGSTSASRAPSAIRFASPIRH